MAMRNLVALSKSTGLVKTSCMVAFIDLVSPSHQEPLQLYYELLGLRALKVPVGKCVRKELKEGPHVGMGQGVVIV